MITDNFFYYWYIWIIVTVITVTVILLWVSSRGCTSCKIPLNPLLYVYMLQQLKYILRQGGWHFPHLLNPDNKRNNTLLHRCVAYISFFCSLAVIDIVTAITVLGFSNCLAQRVLFMSQMLCNLSLVCNGLPPISSALTLMLSSIDRIHELTKAFNNERVAPVTM